MKFKDRAEQRRVIETMADLLLPMIKHLKEDEANDVRIAIRLLENVEIENKHAK